MIISLRSEVKVSVLLEAFEPVLDAAEEIIPHTDGFKEKQRLLADARKAFGTNVCFHSGYGVQKDNRKQFKYFSRAANLGHVGLQVGYYLHAGRGTNVDTVQGAKYYKEAAEVGNEEALWNCARSFLYGEGVEMNLEIGIELLNIAISAGSMEALVVLGDCYWSGMGVEEDWEKAVDIYIAKLQVKTT